MKNPFKYTVDNKRYHTLNYHYKNLFNIKVSKISLDAGFSCPNIDGKAGYGGCIYCTKSIYQNYLSNDDLLKQFEEIKAIENKKWPNSKYIGYFQAHSNTYAPLNILKEKYELILEQTNVIGLNIATRPDCLNEETLDYLEELSNKTYLTIELGLQTIHESTSKLINRCHDLKCFEEAVHNLRKRNVMVVVHIINGLPYETKEMMLDTVRYLSKLDIQGLKIHMLHVLEDTSLENLYQKEHFHILTKQEYIDIVCDQLEILPDKIVIHRITGDPQIKALIEPKWLIKKVNVLNDIDKELLRRNTYQGFNHSIINKMKQLLENNVDKRDNVIDATVGNGHDTLFLASLVPKGHVYGFDIQAIAVKRTEQLLQDNKIKNVTLYNKSHDQILNILSNLKDKIKTVVFNLGYLPNGDKNITTNYKTTIKAIENSMSLLSKNGICLVVIYPGHEVGKTESSKINDFLNKNKDKYTFNYYHNTSNEEAPYLVEIKNITN